ncbi:MAG: sigma-70 family RNA polymerase sigma factor, partial [Oscillospiraceae bacterium]|nr:sigma-70 family RNA polymerase sigma factor [Oscillospiraceae bacterium]
MTDQELVELFLARAEEAVPALAERYGPYCWAVASGVLSDPRDVDECLNDCWLAVWRAIPPAKPERFKGWLAAVVRNRALAMGRENSRRPTTVDEAALELASCPPAGSDPLKEAEFQALG